MNELLTKRPRVEPVSDRVDRSQPYVLSIPAEMAAAELHIGWRSFPVELQSVSWAELTVLASPRVAKLSQQRRRMSLYSCNGIAPVAFSTSAPAAGGHRLLRLRRTDSCQGSTSIRPTLPLRSQSSLLSDPYTAMILLLAAASLLLILPGWGEAWGTSQWAVKMTQQLLGLPRG